MQYHYAVALNEAGQKEEAANVLRPIVQGTADFVEKAAATRLYESLARR